MERLISLSARTLQRGDYTADQIEGALGTVLGVDRQLIADGTFLVVETGGRLVGCGAWSRRRTLFGADALAGRDDATLDPAVDAARIRAFFVHPDHARQGIGTRLLEACEAAARTRGFTSFELVATLTGRLLYARHGYRPVETYDAPLPDGSGLPVVRMVKP